jgi:hypothetical protein
MQVPNWLAGRFEKLVPVSWFTSGSQILYSRRVQGNEPAAGGVIGIVITP